MIAYGNCRFLTSVEKFSAMLKLLNQDSSVAEELKSKNTVSDQFYKTEDWRDIVYNNPEMN